MDSVEPPSMGELPSGQSKAWVSYYAGHSMLKGKYRVVFRTDCKKRNADCKDGVDR